MNLKIFLYEVYSETIQRGELTGEPVKTGAESEFSDRLAGHLDMIDPYLRLVSREASTPVGRIDLLCADENGQAVAIEVKRARVNVGDCYQLIRYLDALEESPEWRHTKARGILVAPVLAKTAKPLIDGERIRFCRLGYDDIC